GDVLRRSGSACHDGQKGGERQDSLLGRDGPDKTAHENSREIDSSLHPNRSRAGRQHPLNRDSK
ncbi:MAG: hypothetical protein ACREDP_25275, partial [Bradyrhizobium sp.]